MIIFTKNITIRFRVNGFLFLLFSMMILKVDAQNSQKVITSINNLFIQNDKYSLDMSFIVYPSYTSKKPISVSKGNFYKSGFNYKNEIDGVISIQNSSYLMLVDPFVEKILVSEASKKRMSPLPVSSIDSILKYYCKSYITTIGNTQDKLTLTYNDKLENLEPYNRIEILYNTTSFIPSKIIFYYSQEVELDDEGKIIGKPRLEMEIYNFNVHPTIPSTIFSLKSYLIKKDNQFLASSQYSNYEVSDIRSKK